MQCSVHGGRIRGRVHRWNHRPMCGACYRTFTSRVRKAPAQGPARQRRTSPRRRDGSLLKALRALLG